MAWLKQCNWELWALANTLAQWINVVHRYDLQVFYQQELESKSGSIWQCSCIYEVGLNNRPHCLHSFYSLWFKSMPSGL